jgi:alkylation response protein AidB-like acyl-CoA dehydrogenase
MTLVAYRFVGGHSRSEDQSHHQSMNILPVSMSSTELLARGTEAARFSAENAWKIDQTGSFPEEEFAKLISAGLIVAPLGRCLGGMGLGFESQSMADLLRLLRILGKGNLSVGRIYEGHVNGLQLIQTFANPDQVEHFAHNARGQKIFGVWNAEAADGLKFHPLGDRKYELIGSKTFCSGAGHVLRPLVGGTLPDGQHQLCVVPMEQVKTQIDSSWWTATGMRASVSYKVDFSGVVLDDSWFIGNPNDYHREPWLTLGVVRFAAVQLGGAEGLVESTRYFLRKLGRTTDPYQIARLGQMALALESGRLWLESAAEKARAFAPVFGGDAAAIKQSVPGLTVYANMVRTAIEKAAMDVMKNAERCVGTRGLLPPEPAERIIRDLRLYLRQPCFDAALAAVGTYALAGDGEKS